MWFLLLDRWLSHCLLMSIAQPTGEPMESIKLGILATTTHELYNSNTVPPGTIPIVKTTGGLARGFDEVPRAKIRLATSLSDCRL